MYYIYFVHVDFNLLLSTWRTLVFKACVMFLLGFYKAQLAEKHLWRSIAVFLVLFFVLDLISFMHLNGKYQFYF